MTIDDIALSLQYGIGARGIVWLLSVFGSAEAVFAASQEELIERAELKPELARSLIAKSSHLQAERELKYMERHSLTAVASTDVQYPALLRECPDYPHVLYVRGSVAALTGAALTGAALTGAALTGTALTGAALTGTGEANVQFAVPAATQGVVEKSSGRMLSIVGTRTITPYGQRMCDILVGRMAELDPGLTIVSGLAYGVDGNCHRAALRHGLGTVAVIASVLPDVTPSQHRELAEEIVDSGGAIVSELHSGTKQNGQYFISRNRIIAGIGEGTVIVESPREGGSLNTAETAESYHRTVMALPGRAGDRCSEGANMLIKRRSAAMVTSGDDIFHEMGWDITTPGRIPLKTVQLPQLSPTEKRVLECFGEGETLDMDTLAERSGIAVGELSGLLLELEIGSLIRALPGKMYERS